MSEIAHFEPGGYRYVRGPFQYSAGVAANLGFQIVRVRLRNLLPVANGFVAIARYLEMVKRPLTAFCACELRSPTPFDDDGFMAFNRIYVNTLANWGIFADDENPVARSNVCPELRGPESPSFYAFSYTELAPAHCAAPSFIVAGSGEAAEVPGPYAQRIMRYGETSTDAMTEKARHVLGAMEARMDTLGVSWSDTTASQAYCVHDIHPFLSEEIVQRGAGDHGLTWYYARPPVRGREFEMDVRGSARELVVEL